MRREGGRSGFARLTVMGFNTTRPLPFHGPRARRLEACRPPRKMEGTGARDVQGAAVWVEIGRAIEALSSTRAFARYPADAIRHRSPLSGAGLGDR